MEPLIGQPDTTSREDVQKEWNLVDGVPGRPLGHAPSLQVTSPTWISSRR